MKRAIRLINPSTTYLNQMVFTAIAVDIQTMLRFCGWGNEQYLNQRK